LAKKLKPIIAAKAKENQIERKGKQAGATPQKSADLSPVETRTQVAKLAGISHDTTRPHARGVKSASQKSAKPIPRHHSPAREGRESPLPT